MDTLRAAVVKIHGKTSHRQVGRHGLSSMTSTDDGKTCSIAHIDLLMSILIKPDSLSLE